VTELGKTIRLRMGGKRRDEEGAVRINLGKQFLITESQNGLGLKGPEGSWISKPPATGRATNLHTEYQPRLPRAPSNLALNTSRDEAYVCFVENLGVGNAPYMCTSSLLFLLRLLTFRVRPEFIIHRCPYRVCFK